MFHNHSSMIFTQIGIGLGFTVIYFVIFRTLILHFNLKTPGREDSEVKLYTKADYKAAQSPQHSQAMGYLQALGGAANISTLNNCATRLRITLFDMAKTESDEVFKALGAHGVVRHGEGIQVIVGLNVLQVRDQIEALMKIPSSAEKTTMTEVVS